MTQWNWTPWRTIATLRATNSALHADNEQLLRERDDARAQRDRLNDTCDQLQRDAARQYGEVYALLVEATQARDEYRAKYEALRTKLNKPPQGEDEAVSRVTPQDERTKRPSRKRAAE